MVEDFRAPEVRGAWVRSDQPPPGCTPAEACTASIAPVLRAGSKSLSASTKWSPMIGRDTGDWNFSFSSAIAVAARQSRLLPIAATGLAAPSIGAAISRTQGRVDVICCTCRRARRSGGVCKLTSCTHIVQISIRRVLATSGSLVVAPTTRFWGWTCLPSSTPTYLPLGPAGRYTGRHLPALVSVLKARANTQTGLRPSGSVSGASNERRPKEAR